MRYEKSGIRWEGFVFMFIVSFGPVRDERVGGLRTGAVLAPQPKGQRSAGRSEIVGGHDGPGRRRDPDGGVGRRQR